MDILDFFEFINKHTWTFSNSMKRIPHYYVCKEYLNEEDKVEFENAVIFIIENGIKAYFWKKPYIYLEVDGFFYWAMGHTVEETIIINRASCKQYRLVRKENYNVMEMIK